MSIATVDAGGHVASAAAPACPKQQRRIFLAFLKSL